jgi:hypothetical protein
MNFKVDNGEKFIGRRVEGYSQWHPETSEADIRLSPTVCDFMNVDNSARRTIYRIGTILHEVLHAYVESYSCDDELCRTRPDNRGYDDGHGRAWQLIAVKLEEVAGQLLNIELDLGRWTALEQHIQSSYRIMPSECDLRNYGF